jgi:hypothetical protein
MLTLGAEECLRTFYREVQRLPNSKTDECDESCEGQSTFHWQCSNYDGDYCGGDGYFF